MFNKLPIPRNRELGTVLKIPPRRDFGDGPQKNTQKSTQKTENINYIQKVKQKLYKKKERCIWKVE